MASEFIPSHRSTTSSRKPGAAITGTVQVELRRLERCAHCDRLWHGGDVHATHWSSSGELVDCVGRPVRR